LDYGALTTWPLHAVTARQKLIAGLGPPCRGIAPPIKCGRQI